MTITVGYFKEVSVAGRDFDRGVNVELGAWVPPVGRLRMRLGGGYIVADRATETAGAGEWPCRLYQVEVPDGDWPRVDPHIVRVPTYRPVAEIEALEVLGPQGRDVSEVLDRAAQLTFGDVVRLGSSTPEPWQQTSDGASAIVDANRSAVERTARHGALMAASGAAATAVTVARDKAIESGELTSAALAVSMMALGGEPEFAKAGERHRIAQVAYEDISRVLYDRATLAVLHAAWAYVMRDELTSRDFEALSARWRAVAADPSEGAASYPTIGLDARLTGDTLRWK